MVLLNSKYRFITYAVPCITKKVVQMVHTLQLVHAVAVVTSVHVDHVAGLVYDYNCPFSTLQTFPATILAPSAVGCIPSFWFSLGLPATL